jgi:hypothetical protein
MIPIQVQRFMPHPHEPLNLDGGKRLSALWVMKMARSRRAVGTMERARLELATFRLQTECSPS